MINKLFKVLPYFLQNTLVTIYNVKQYRLRHGGKYRYLFDYYERSWSMSDSELDYEAKRKEKDFLDFAITNTNWYSKYLNYKSIKDFRVLEKIDIINNLSDISSVKTTDGVVSFTGGTTGASMKVIYTKDNLQERFAILDSFRKKFGYSLGKKTAWFSGKNIITSADLKKSRCLHYDFINKIGFYSTFFINDNNFDVYWKSLVDFKPEFMVGFPSSVSEIARIANERGLVYPEKVKTFFPTAETVSSEQKAIISKVFGCKIIDQYASSEGAPFILECTHGEKHIHPLTGLFEVVDENMQSVSSGQILVTSYTTYGTPLIRYRIGDSITLDTQKVKCKCGCNFPIVSSIEGRTNDYVISKEFGRVNLGNLSNSTKDVEGIICFQIIQNDLNFIEVNVVRNKKFNKKQLSSFKSKLHERVGNNMEIRINIVSNISREKSGKFRIVKNSLV